MRRTVVARITLIPMRSLAGKVLCNGGQAHVVEGLLFIGVIHHLFRCRCPARLRVKHRINRILVALPILVESLTGQVVPARRQARHCLIDIKSAVILLGDGISCIVCSIVMRRGPTSCTLEVIVLDHVGHILHRHAEVCARRVAVGRVAVDGRGPRHAVAARHVIDRTVGVAVIADIDHGTIKRLRSRIGHRSAVLQCADVWQAAVVAWCVGRHVIAPRSIGQSRNVSHTVGTCGIDGRVHVRWCIIDRTSVIGHVTRLADAGILGRIDESRIGVRCSLETP